MNAFRTRCVSLVLVDSCDCSPAGCRSPYYADRGAGVGALGGAGVGALVGNAVGDTAAGALIGAGVGALGGAAVGSAIDEVQAQNRAEIAAAMGRQVQPGAATIEEVVAMSQQGVDAAADSELRAHLGHGAAAHRRRRHLPAQRRRADRRDPDDADAAGAAGHGRRWSRRARR